MSPATYGGAWASLHTAYIMLLMLPHSHPWRMCNQEVYAALRDGLAEITAQSNETVQDEYEAIVLGVHLRLSSH